MEIEKIQVIGGSKQMVGNKQMDGEGVKLSYTLRFKGSKIYIDILNDIYIYFEKGI